MIYCDIEGDERSFGLFFGCISRFFLVWYPPEFCFDPVLTHRHLIRHMPGAWCGTSGNCEAGLLAWRLDSVPAKPAPHFWKKQKLKHFSSLLFAFAHLGYLELQNTEDIFTADFWAASCYHVAMSRLAPVGAQVGRVAKTACLAAWLLEEFAEGEPSSGAISIEHGSRKGDSSSVAFSEFWNWFGICSASSNSFCHVYPVEGALRLAASCVFSCFFRFLSFLQTNPFVFDALHFPLDLNCQNPKDSAAKKVRLALHTDTGEAMGSRHRKFHLVCTWKLQERLPSYILAITGHGRCKQWQQAIDIFLSIKKNQVNIYIYNATISACEKTLEMFIVPAVEGVLNCWVLVRN